jgi:hypothetical protein
VLSARDAGWLSIGWMTPGKRWLSAASCFWLAFPFPGVVLPFFQLRNIGGNGKQGKAKPGDAAIRLEQRRKAGQDM